MFHTIWRHHRILFCGTIQECMQYLLATEWLIDGYTIEPSTEHIHFVGSMTENYCLEINTHPISLGRGI